MKYSYETLLLAQMLFIAYKDGDIDIDRIKKELIEKMGKENFEKEFQKTKKELKNIKKILDN